MLKTEILAALDEIIDAAQVAILATVDPEGRPAMRWMTPATVRGRPGYLYAVSSPQSRKVHHLQSCRAVVWLFQTPELNRIVTVQGRMSAIDNPQLKSEVLESIGPRLEVFWRVNEMTDFIVLETAIEEISVFQPMKHVRDTVLLDEENRR
jgi:pyridoxamine 5'-phosphate oxidase